MAHPSTPKPGMLAIWHNVVAGHQAEVADWYNAEHHFERIDTPGFVQACRYVAMDPSQPHFFCLYQTVDAAVLSSDAYLDRVNNPSPWTRDIMPLYRDLSRTVCALAYQQGRASGGFLAVLAIADSTADLSAELLEPMFLQLLRQPGALRCRWLAAAPTGSPSSSIEAQLRGRPDDLIHAAILIDANDEAQASAMLIRLETMLQDAGLAYTALQRGVYRQVFAAGSCGSDHRPT